MEISHRPIGIFDGNSDVGTELLPGTVRFDASDDSYVVTGSGLNMWFRTDAFHFVWKEVSGNAVLSANIAFESEGKNAHRKACLVIRQSLDADSAYADVAIHGDGLTSLQYRDAKGEVTREVQSNVHGPARARIERRGDYVSISVSDASGDLSPSGGSVRLELQEPFYIGLAVCAHESDQLETAKFSKVQIGIAGEPKTLYSTLETISIASTDRRVVAVVPRHIEAPNWTPDGSSLIFNGGGRLYRIPVTGGQPTEIDTDFAIRCNNDHGISPDGSTIVISDQSQAPHQSIIYTLPVSGGVPSRITEGYPSYWHGWSPDGKTLAYCAQRDGHYGIFTIPVTGGKEVRLTTATNLDDGPDYSHDGHFIYFNSDRTGKMQIWRIDADGQNLIQITNDAFNNWFAHPSPDGKWLVILSYGADVAGHPADKDVQLRLMSLESGELNTIAKLFGGQGTINVPSWSPDSKQVAFVSYQYLD